MDITDEQMAEWEALADAANATPWGYDRLTARQADFADEARTAVPALIAALRQARARHDAPVHGSYNTHELNRLEEHVRHLRANQDSDYVSIPWHWFVGLTETARALHADVARLENDRNGLERR